MDILGYSCTYSVTDHLDGFLIFETPSFRNKIVNFRKNIPWFWGIPRMRICLKIGQSHGRPQISWIIRNQSSLFVWFFPNISSHIFPYLTIFSHIFPYFSICSHIFPYLSICFHIFPYFSIFFHSSSHSNELFGDPYEWPRHSVAKWHIEVFQEQMDQLQWMTIFMTKIDVVFRIMNLSISS